MPTILKTKHYEIVDQGPNKTANRFSLYYYPEANCFPKDYWPCYSSQTQEEIIEEFWWRIMNHSGQYLWGGKTWKKKK